MKIYLVITPFFPSQTSFRGPFIYDQVMAIKRTQLYDQVIVMKSCSIYDSLHDYVYGGVDVYSYRNYALPTMLFPGILDILTCLSFTRKLDKMKVGKDDISVCHVHVVGSLVPALYLKKRNVKMKVVVHHHGLDVLCLQVGHWNRLWKWHRNWTRRYNELLCCQADIQVGVSHRVIEELQVFSRLKASRTYVLYNGVDGKKFYPAEKVNKKRGERFRIGCVANFQKIKDQMCLLKAVNDLLRQRKSLSHRIEVSFIGTGDQLALCKSYVMRNGLESYIEFKSEMDHTQLREYYCSLDLFVLPSYYEAFGCVYLEAWACGVPFICCSGQGITEYICMEDVGKWVFDPHDWQVLSERIYNFVTKKWEQRLNYPVSIDVLVTNFMKQL